MTDPSTVHDAAYQGQPGAYSEHAARQMCGACASLLPCDTLAMTFAAVADGRAQAAVVPLENTLAGPVPGAISLLLASGLVVHGERTEHIDHVLAAPAGASLDTLCEVLSHPVALAQCERFFKQQRAIRAVPVFDTAGALQIVMQTRDVTRGAIAGRAAAALYGASILAEHLQDHDANFTRFVRIAEPPGPALSSGPCRVLLGLRLVHRPGSLAAALNTLAAFDVNLTRLDSSPVPGCPFEYEFVLEGVVNRSEACEPALDALRRQSVVRLLGAFDADHQIDTGRRMP